MKIKYLAHASFLMTAASGAVLSTEIIVMTPDKF